MAYDVFAGLSAVISADDSGPIGDRDFNDGGRVNEPREVRPNRDGPDSVNDGMTQFRLVDA